MPRRLRGNRPPTRDGAAPRSGVPKVPPQSERRHSVSRAESGETSMVSRAPPARVTSCWTLSSASARSLAQRSWRATPRSYRARERSSGWPPASSSATVRWRAARASSNESWSMGVSARSAASVTFVVILLGAVDRPAEPGRDDAQTEPYGADEDGDRAREHEEERGGGTEARRVEELHRRQ